MFADSFLPEAASGNYSKWCFEMKVSSSTDNAPQAKRKLRNFDLSVDEIRVVKAIRDMTQALEDIKQKNIYPERLEFFRSEIRQLEDRLEEIRENTLLR